MTKAWGCKPQFQNLWKTKLGCFMGHEEDSDNLQQDINKLVEWADPRFSDPQSTIRDQLHQSPLWTILCNWGGGSGSVNNPLYHPHTHHLNSGRKYQVPSQEQIWETVSHLPHLCRGTIPHLLTPDQFVVLELCELCAECEIAIHQEGLTTPMVKILEGQAWAKVECYRDSAPTGTVITLTECSILFPQTQWIHWLNARYIQQLKQCSTETALLSIGPWSQPTDRASC